jgi:hypothetical protein
MHAEDSERGLRLEITIGARGEEEVERVEKAKKRRKEEEIFISFQESLLICLTPR